MTVVFKGIQRGIILNVSDRVGVCLPCFIFFIRASGEDDNGGNTVMRCSLKETEVQRQKLTTISVFLLRGTNRQTK